MDATIPPRPPTPQVLLHRLPDKDDEAELSRKPSKYIVLIMGSTGVAGKLAIARSVSSALSCPLDHGDSVHQSSAKAASVSASDAQKKARYQRMWLAKMTRTGLLFPEESRPATEGFTGFGGSSTSSASRSTSSSRRGSASSIASVASLASSSLANPNEPAPTSPYRAQQQQAGHPVTSTFQSIAASRGSMNATFTLSEEERKRRANPVLMVLTHPELEPWHKTSIRTAVGEYGIGVIFVPLYVEPWDDDEEEDGEELPVLRPLDPRTMTSFPVPGGSSQKETGWGTLDREMKIRIDVDGDVEGRAAEIVERVSEAIGVDFAAYKSG